MWNLSHPCLIKRTYVFIQEAYAIPPTLFFSVGRHAWGLEKQFGEVGIGEAGIGEVVIGIWSRLLVTGVEQTTTANNSN